MQEGRMKNKVLLQNIFTALFLSCNGCERQSVSSWRTCEVKGSKVTDSQVI